MNLHIPAEERAEDAWGAIQLYLSMTGISARGMETVNDAIRRYGDARADLVVEQARGQHVRAAA